MNLCVYPCEAGSVARFRALGQELKVSSLRFWRWDDLHCGVGELIRAGVDHHPVNYGVQRGMGGVRQDVILMHGVQGTDVRSVMSVCRVWPRRPIIAVATPQSVEMSLAVLFEHLSYDRAHEEQLRRG